MLYIAAEPRHCTLCLTGGPDNNGIRILGRKRGNYSFFKEKIKKTKSQTITTNIS